MVKASLKNVASSFLLPCSGLLGLRSCSTGLGYFMRLFSMGSSGCSLNNLVVSLIFPPKQGQPLPNLGFARQTPSAGGQSAKNLSIRRESSCRRTSATARSPQWRPRGSSLACRLRPCAAYLESHGQNPNRLAPSEHPNPHENRLNGWCINLPQSGTIGFDPQPCEG